MNCSTVRQLLNDYVEGDLADSISSSVSEHLQECEQCAAEEALLRKLAAVLRSLPEKPAPSNFTVGVMAKLSGIEDVAAVELSGEKAAEPVSEEKRRLSLGSGSKTALRSTYTGFKMMFRPVKYAKYMPGFVLKVRTGDKRSQSLTRLPLALGFRW